MEEINNEKQNKRRETLAGSFGKSKGDRIKEIKLKIKLLKLQKKNNRRRKKVLRKKLKMKTRR
jgi:hypothetical protein